MNRSYPYYIFVLKNYIPNLIGLHYPTEIIGLIIMATYVKIKINCGHNHTTIISDHVYVCGRNLEGRLGLGHKINQCIPQKLNFNFNFNKTIKSISCGAHHTIALTNSNEIYAWGGNEYGQVGLAHNQNQYLPQKILLENIMSVSCGECHTIVLTNYNKIYVWGQNHSGQLGLQHTQNQSYPSELIIHEPILSISCGSYHTIALTKFNKIYVWGQNNFGQLGMGHYIDQYSPQELRFGFESESIMTISCGMHHTVLLTKSGYVYSCGDNRLGELGLGNYTKQFTPHKVVIFEPIIAISCGIWHTLCLTKQNEIYIWGRTRISGLESSQFLPQKLNLVNIMEIHCGGFHTMALTIFNEIFVWGFNAHGQLGLGDTISRDSPQKLKFDF